MQSEKRMGVGKITWYHYIDYGFYSERNGDLMGK
jgi:hypothetical protein